MKGDNSVERFMPPVERAIEKHIKKGSPAAIEIYNRAYEAVELALNAGKLNAHFTPTEHRDETLHR